MKKQLLQEASEFVSIKHSWNWRYSIDIKKMGMPGKNVNMGAFNNAMEKINKMLSIKNECEVN